MTFKLKPEDIVTYYYCPEVDTGLFLTSLQTDLSRSDNKFVFKSAEGHGVFEDNSGEWIYIKRDTINSKLIRSLLNIVK